MQTAPYDLERGYSIYSGSVIKMLLTYFMAQQPFKIPFIYNPFHSHIYLTLLRSNKLIGI